MRHGFLTLFFAAALFSLSAVCDLYAQQDTEPGIQQVVQNMQDSWNRKDGKGFSDSFADEHDYVVIDGMFAPKATREGNAKMHQQIFDTVYKEVDLQLRVAKVRHLTPAIAVVHIQGHTYNKGKTDQKRTEIIVSAVMQKKKDRWEIVAFQNTPVQPRQQKPLQPVSH